MGDVPAAISEMEKVAEQAPSNLVGVFYLARGYIISGDVRNARSGFSNGQSRRAGRTTSRDSRGRCCRPVKDDARKRCVRWTKELQKFASELGRVSVTLAVAEFFAILDEKDTALDWLARAVRNAATSGPTGSHATRCSPASGINHASIKS